MKFSLTKVAARGADVSCMDKVALQLLEDHAGTGALVLAIVPSILWTYAKLAAWLPGKLVEAITGWRQLFQVVRPQRAVAIQDRRKGNDRRTGMDRRQRDVPVEFDRRSGFDRRQRERRSEPASVLLLFG